MNKIKKLIMALINSTKDGIKNKINNFAIKMMNTY